MASLAITLERCAFTLGLFLFGSGFNADAGRCQTPEGGDCWYPQLADTAALCFNKQIPVSESIEHLFSAAEQSRDNKPMDTLIRRLVDADFYLAYRQISSSGSSNCYHKFFDAFRGATFLTFNYDSLPEIFLFRAGMWFPNDGYGVEVEADIVNSLMTDKFVRKPSASIVLHLHGSICLHASDFEIKQDTIDTIPQIVHRDIPRYGFDPERLSECFRPYHRTLWPTGYVPLRDRIIAPIPNKAEGLTASFIQTIYNTATRKVRESGTVIAVGYSFNTHDRASYDPILQALAESDGKRLVVVSPEAQRLAELLAHRHRRIHIRPVEKTLKSWAADSFRV